MALQHVLAEDLKANEIEVGVALVPGEAEGLEGGVFRMLSHDEVDEHLVIISEKD